MIFVEAFLRPAVNESAYSVPDNITESYGN